MTILYGDSTASTLDTNYLEFLRDALVFLVEVAQASHGVIARSALAEERGRETSQDFTRLDVLETLVQRALAGAPTFPADSAAARCAAAISHAVAELARGERDDVQAQLGRDIARSETEIAQLLQRCVRALETLLARHDLPEITETLRIQSNIEAPFAARLHGTTPYGLMIDLELDVSAGHLFAQPLRIDRVVDRLEVHAPDMSGWLQKSIKLKPQRLERYHLIELVIAASGTRIKLRSMPDGTGDGFDLHVPPAPGRTSLVRIGEQGDTLGDPTVPEDKEAEAVTSLVDRLRTAALELRTKRKRLADARLDGDPIAGLEEPALIIDRMVGAMAPVVREIARHSLSADELVLKRMLADGKREEYFISMSELRALLDQSPLGVRAHFTPLGLDASAPVMPAMERKSVAPPPAPSRLELAGPEVTAFDDDEPDEDESEVTIEISVSGLDPLPQPPPQADPAGPPKSIAPRPLDASGPPRPRLPPRPSVAPASAKPPGRNGST